MLHFPSGASHIKEYQRYRALARKLADKIMKALVDKTILDDAGRALGLFNGDTLVFDREEDISIMADFSIYEVRRHGKNMVQRYQEEIGGSNPTENDLLAGMVKAETGLFTVVRTMPTESQTIMRSLVGERREITLTDIGFSHTLLSGLVVFVRPVETSKFTITSGIAFAFPHTMERELVLRWQGKRKVKHPTERYVTYYRLSKQKGLETRFM